MSLVRWRPFNHLARMTASGMFDELLNTALETRGSDGNVWYPRVDVRDGGDRIEVHAELPGMSKDAIKITCEDANLTISGERTFEDRESGGAYHRLERQYGRFTRTFRLPAEVDRDRIEANYRDGVLRITLPKVEAKMPREISVNVN